MPDLPMYAHSVPMPVPLLLHPTLSHAARCCWLLVYLTDPGDGSTVTNADLGAALQVSADTAGRIVAELEDAGFVRRDGSTRKRRIRCKLPRPINRTQPDSSPQLTAHSPIVEGGSKGDTTSLSVLKNTYNHSRSTYAVNEHPTLEDVCVLGEMAGVPREACEAWYLKTDAERDGWEKVGSIPSALRKYWFWWQRNRDADAPTAAGAYNGWEDQA